MIFDGILIITVIMIMIYYDYDSDYQVRACPPAPGHREVLVPGQWEVKEAEKRRREVRCVVIIGHYCDYCDYCISLWWSCDDYSALL